MSAKSYLSLFAVTGLILWGVYLLLPAYTEYNKTERQLHDVDSNLLARQTDSEELLGDINRLKHDPQAIERVAREKFGWARPEEKVYDFSKWEQEPTPAPAE